MSAEKEGPPVKGRLRLQRIPGDLIELKLIPPITPEEAEVFSSKARKMMPIIAEDGLISSLVIGAKTFHEHYHKQMNNARSYTASRGASINYYFPKDPRKKRSAFAPKIIRE
jgi:hypothetical protein